MTWRHMLDDIFKEYSKIIQNKNSHRKFTAEGTKIFDVEESRSTSYEVKIQG